MNKVEYIMPHPEDPSSNQVEYYFRFREAPRPQHSRSAPTSFDIMQSMLDELRRQAEVQGQQAAMQLEHDKRIKLLEVQVEPDPQLYAITGWTNLRGIRMMDKNYGMFGRFAAKQARIRGIRLGARKHSIYGVVNTYPLEFLDEMYELWQKED